VTPTLDIVIVSYNTRGELAACLASLAAHPPAGLREIVVVDNASSDGSADAVRRDWPEVRLVQLDRNLGFAAANNTALRQSQSDLVLLLNSDTVVPSGAVDALIDRLTASGAVAAGPLLVDADGRPELSYGPMLTPAGELRQMLRGRLARSRTAIGRRYAAGLVAREREVDWVSGACLLVSRAAALEAGFLDERYFFYEEDVDFCAALRARGGRVLFTPAARIVHLRGRAAGRSGGAARQAYDRSHLLFYAKHAPHWVPWLRVWQRLRGRSFR